MHESTLYNWTKVDAVTASELRELQMKELTIAQKNICIIKKQERIFAFAATCPHAGARLCEGWVDALGRIVCPQHGYRFDPGNGRNTSGEGYKLRTYPVEVKEDIIYIGLIN